MITDSSKKNKSVRLIYDSKIHQVKSEILKTCSNRDLIFYLLKSRFLRKLIIKTMNATMLFAHPYAMGCRIQLTLFPNIIDAMNNDYN